jgi:hypothetical protein
MSKLLFDASKVAPATPFEPVPAGWYPVVIDKSEVKPVKPPGSGKYIKIECVIIDGEYKNRRIFAQLNIENKSAQAQEIGQQQFSALCHATGVIRLNDTQELHGKPFQIKVSVKADEGYEPKNDVKGFKAVEGGAPAAATGAPAPAWAGKPAGAAPAAPAAKTPPPPPAAKKPAPPAPPKPKDDRKFFCYINGETSVELDAAAVANNMAQYGLDVPVCLVSSESWGVGADYQIAAAQPASETPAPATQPPPWQKPRK